MHKIPFDQAILIGTYKQNRSECEEHLKELEELSRTYGLKTLTHILCPIRSYDAATLIGKGKIEEIKGQIPSPSTLVIFDDEISPKQQRNLEELLEGAVIDRTELILGVFAQRAHSREAKIQVELASLHYQLPRLRRLWTHLGRQKTGGSGTSGGGYLKGEGEKQIEIDRRILKKRITQLDQEIEEVGRVRALQKRSRTRRGIPTFALIGYTNTGKSTLLNALTAADVLVEDKLFATLDTTTRKFCLPNQQTILLIDTVGFIRKLPHLLVAAFRSTLEEAVDADILLHLIDISHPQAWAQAQATQAVLKELGAEDRPILTLLNKIDQCTDRALLQKMKLCAPKTIEISALHRTGFDSLLELITQEISALRSIVSLRIPQSHYALVSEILREGQVLSCEYEGNEILLEAEIPRRLEPKVAMFR